MKFAIFGNTYQAKKSSHAVTLFKLLKKQGAEIGMKIWILKQINYLMVMILLPIW